MAITVLKNPENSETIQKEIATIVESAWHSDFQRLSKTPEKTVAALCGGFLSQYFYIPHNEAGNAVGVAACVPPGTRAIRLEASRMRRAYGLFMGTIAHRILSSEFEGPLHIALEPDTGYIEFVGTTPAAQGKGVATILMQTILQSGSHSRYVLEVVDTNANAIRLYQKLGFAEFARIPEKHPKQVGFAYRIYMRHSR